MNFKMNDYETYEKYVALKLHFTSEYDYFRYNGKTSVTPKSFDVRKDKFHFKRLATKYDDSTIIEYFVANFIHLIFFRLFRLFQLFPTPRFSSKKETVI